MKKIFLLSLISFINLDTFAQWQWAKRGGGNRQDYARNICVDASGDVYMMGHMYWISGGVGSESYAIFDSDTVFNNGANEVFLVKYSGSAGNVIWAKGIGASNGIPTGSSCDNCELAYNVSYDPTNNCIYATGTFYGLAAFDTTTIGGFNDLFFSKFDLNGNYIWTKSLKIDNANSISTKSVLAHNGYVYLCGGGGDSMSIGGFRIPKGGFVAKYNSQGTCLWVKHQTNASIGNLFFYQNDIYAYGSSTLGANTMIIGSNTYTLSTSPGNTVFLTKMDTLTNVKWIRQIPSSVLAVPGGMVSDTTNLYFCGYFQSGVTIGTNTFATSATYDMYLGKCDTAGNFIWAKKGNANTFVTSLNILRSDSTNFYVLGGVSGSINFGACSYGSVNSGYLALFDSSGSCLSTDLVSGTSFAKDNSGSLFFTGTFTNTLTIGTYTLTGDQYGEVFVAKRNALTGIEERQSNSNNNTLIIYANPTAGKCNITIPDDFLYENNLTLQVYDVMGRLLQNAKIEVRQDEIKLNLEAEAKGVYNVILSNGKKSYTGKIIFE